VNTLGESIMSFKSESDAKAYWKENLSLMVKLLIIWFVVSFGCGILLVDVLNQIQIGGYKLGFWFAQQGSIYTFVILVFYYTKKMGQLDRKYGVDDE
jgi:putative solute:sodium symporter small subunit